MYACRIFLGDLLIIIAQIITAAQMVYEEKFVMKHNIPPLQAVGWEGTVYFLYFMEINHIFIYRTYLSYTSFVRSENPRNVFKIFARDKGIDDTY